MSHNYSLDTTEYRWWEWFRLLALPFVFIWFGILLICELSVIGAGKVKMKIGGGK